MSLSISLELFLAALLIFSVLFDVFQTVIVPRWTSRRWRLAPLIIAGLWPWWLRAGLRFKLQRRRDEWLGAFAPLSVLLVLLAWLVVIMLGYGLAVYGLKNEMEPRPSTFFGAVYIAGSSLLTIGYGDFVPKTSLIRLVFLSAGSAGLAMFALVISWLFTIYQSFARREALVLTLDGRAGVPPSGVTLLETFALLDMTDEFHSTFTQWELWTADILDSHLAYPLLPFFRSSHDNESWISALGAVMDAATLLFTTVERGPNNEKLALGAAHMMYRLGCHAVEDFSHYFQLRLPVKVSKAALQSPHPGVEISEWRAARQRLEKAGYSLKNEDEAWQEFAAKRAVYAWELNNLAKLFAAVPTQWIGDRTTLPYMHHVH